MTRRPDFFIVGAPKCGTTAMTRYVEAHPDVFVAERKDVHFFGRDLDFRRRERDSLGRYLDRFKGAGDATRIGESSVWYLYSTSAAAEIAAFAPDARVIAMLRHPVDVMYALWAQLRFNGLGDEDITDFALALAAEPDRALGRRIPPESPLPSSLLYRKAATFSEQIERYHAALGRERVHVVLQDEMKADTAAAVRGVFEFLEVDPTFLPDLGRVNTSKAVRSERVRSLLRMTPSHLKDLMPRGLRERARSTLRRLNSRHEQRAPLDPALRASLTDEFRPEIERLGEVIGRDLSRWTAG